MNKNTALINEAVGKALKLALSKHPQTQIQIGAQLGISTKLLQNYSNGIFPKYKGENIRALDKLLKTSFYTQLYESELNSEINVPRETSRDELGPSYIEQRRLGKIVGDDYFVPFVPVKASAGYS